MKKSKIFQLLLLCSVSSTLFAAELYQMPRKKIIELSWSMPTSDRLVKNPDLYDNSPLDGISVILHEPRFKVRDDTLFSARKWQYEWLKPAIGDLKKIKFKNLTDNFLYAGIQPGDVDWFNDEHWAGVCNNIGLLARAAKEIGFKGILLDLEEYKTKLWQNTAVPGKSRAEINAKVRQRGREYGNAIFKEYPDINIIAIWWLSLVRNYRSDPAGAQSLLGPFINGIYDVITPAAVIHEGQEKDGYLAKNEDDFKHLRLDFEYVFPHFLAPENINKFKLQTRLAAPIYMDAIVRGESFWWGKCLYPELGKMGALNFYARNLAYAMQYSDEYVWLYSERVAWWKVDYRPDNPPELEKVYPGINEITRNAADPLKLARIMRKKNPAKSVVRNGDFQQANDGKNIPHWWFYHDDPASSKAFLKSRKDGLLIGNMIQGDCIVQQVKVAPEREYIFKIRGKIAAGKESNPVVRIGGTWQSADGNYPLGFHRQVMIFIDKFAADGSFKYEQLISSPHNAGTMQLTVGFYHPKKEQSLLIEKIEMLPVLYKSGK